MTSTTWRIGSLPGLADGRGARRQDADIYSLIEAEIPRLRRYARYLCRDVDRADDLVQDCLTRAIAKIHTYEPGTNLRGWLFVILRNAYFSELRRHRHEFEPLDDLSEHPSLTTPGHDQTSVTLGELKEAFLRLSQEHREVIVLVAMEGMPYEAAAAILDVPVGTVRSRLSRARQALRLAIDGEPVAARASRENHAG